MCNIKTFASHVFTGNGCVKPWIFNQTQVCITGIFLFNRYRDIYWLCLYWKSVDRPQTCIHAQTHTQVIERQISSVNQFIKWVFKVLTVLFKKTCWQTASIHTWTYAYVQMNIRTCAHALTLTDVTDSWTSSVHTQKLICNPALNKNELQTSSWHKNTRCCRGRSCNWQLGLPRKSVSCQQHPQCFSSPYTLCLQLRLQLTFFVAFTA